ncbi:MAG: alkaline shock response membrane anchor protein AmaP [Thermacetogeniaceae bacterium]
MRQQNLFFLIVFALIVLFLSGCAIAVALGLLHPQEQIDMFLSEVGNRWGLAAGGTFLAILSLWCLLAVFRRPREREVIIHESGLGRIQISAAALENMIRRAVRDVRDVREVKPVLRLDHDGLVILLHMSVNPEADLPQVSQDVQGIVQEYLEKKGGVQVSKVQVIIQSVASDIRPRVE